MHHAHDAALQIDLLDVADNDVRAVQQRPEGTDDVGDVHVAGCDLVQHGSEEKEVVTADERHVDVFAMAEPPLELTGRFNAAKSAAEHDNAGSSHKWSSASLDVGDVWRLHLTLIRRG